MINGCWSGAPGVNPVAKIWQQHVALASHPPSMLLPGHASTNRKHTVDSPPPPASSDVIIGVSAPTWCTYTAVPVGVLSCSSVRGLNHNSWLDFLGLMMLYFMSPKSRSRYSLLVPEHHRKTSLLWQLCMWPPSHYRAPQTHQLKEKKGCFSNVGMVLAHICGPQLVNTDFNQTRRWDGIKNPLKNYRHVSS